MSKHTPEPWALFEVGDGRPHLCPASESDKMSILTIAEEDGVTFACVYKDSDALRIVTCVNACAGMADPAAEIAELKRQRDELLVALGVAIPLIKQARLDLCYQNVECDDEDVVTPYDAILYSPVILLLETKGSSS